MRFTKRLAALTATAPSPESVQPDALALSGCLDENAPTALALALAAAIVRATRAHRGRNPHQVRAGRARARAAIRDARGRFTATIRTG
jgi:hypothetical protein